MSWLHLAQKLNCIEISHKIPGFTLFNCLYSATFFFKNLPKRKKLIFAWSNKDRKSSRMIELFYLLPQTALIWCNTVECNWKKKKHTHNNLHATVNNSHIACSRKSSPFYLTTMSNSINNFYLMLYEKTNKKPIDKSRSREKFNSMTNSSRGVSCWINNLVSLKLYYSHFIFLIQQKFNTLFE